MSRNGLSLSLWIQQDGEWCDAAGPSVMRWGWVEDEVLRLCLVQDIGESEVRHEFAVLVAGCGPERAATCMAHAIAKALSELAAKERQRE